MFRFTLNKAQFRNKEVFEDLAQEIFGEDFEMLEDGKYPWNKLCHIEVRAYNLRAYERTGKLMKKKTV